MKYLGEYAKRNKLCWQNDAVKGKGYRTRAEQMPRLREKAKKATLC